MKFSFLITFYNQEEFVDNCFETIKKIKIPTDFEMTVGDDGSIDKTREKLEYWKSHFGEDKFKIITSNRNDGVINITVRVSNLRKKLLKESSGDYILHLDGDDFYCDYDFIVDTINLVEKHPNISVIMFKYRMLDGNKIIEADTINLKEGLVDKKEYIRTRYVNSGACVLKRIKNERFNQMLDKTFFYTDNPMLIFNFCFGDVWHIPKNILNYRKSTNSMWNSMKQAQQLVNLFAIYENIVFLAEEFKNDIFYHYRKQLLYSYFIRKNMESKVGKEFLNEYKNYVLGYLGKTILNYNDASEEDKIETDKFIQEVRNFDPDLYEKMEKDASI